VGATAPPSQIKVLVVMTLSIDLYMVLYMTNNIFGIIKIIS